RPPWTGSALAPELERELVARLPERDRRGDLEPAQLPGRQCREAALRPAAEADPDAARLARGDLEPLRAKRHLRRVRQPRHGQRQPSAAVLVARAFQDHGHAAGPQGGAARTLRDEERRRRRAAATRVPAAARIATAARWRARR